MHQEADKHISKCLRLSLYTTDQKIKYGGQKSHDFSYNLVFKLQDYVVAFSIVCYTVFLLKLASFSYL